MIRFIDLETGNVFNGSHPYIFWFDKEQSTNLFYIKKICILSNKSIIQCSIKDNSIFSIIDVDEMINLKDQTIDHQNYKDLTKSICREYTSQGSSYDGYFVHMLYILGHSNIAGEFREDVRIDDEDFTVAADFYNENEVLSINLGNIGLDLPKSIQKAIYDSNVHEDSVDNILLNRKLKELLLHHVDIIGSKGSYKSLLESVAWFEYGDLLKIYEYWQYPNIIQDMIQRSDIEQVVTEKSKQILNSLKKTTYIGLYLALQKIRKNKYGDIVYQDQGNPLGDRWWKARTEPFLGGDDYWLSIQEGEVNIKKTDDIDNIDEVKFIPEENGGFIPEPIPEIINISTKWSPIDLSLKMTMLGNFFSTYFMPIHLDLLHSTVENIVYANTIKLFSWGDTSRVDYIDNIGSFECNIKENDIYYLGVVRAMAYPDTTFADDIFNSDGSYKEQSDIHIFGVETEFKDWPSEGDISNSDRILFDSQYFNDIGVVIPFQCTFRDIQKGCVFTQARICIVSNGTSEIHDTINIHNNIDEVNSEDYTGIRHISFNIILQKLGNYTIYVKFHLNNGHDYMRMFHISVSDDVSQAVRLYKIVKRDYADLMNIVNDTRYDLNDYMFSMTDTLNNKSSIRYRQFLAARNEAYKNTISTNTCILYQPKYDAVNKKLEYYFVLGNKIFQKEYVWDDNVNIDDLLAELRNNATGFTNYTWNAWNRIIYMDGPVTIPYIVGVCKYFDIPTQVEIYNKKWNVFIDGNHYNLSLVSRIDPETLEVSFNCDHEKYVYVECYKNIGDKMVSFWQDLTEYGKDMMSFDPSLNTKIIIHNKKINIKILFGDKEQIITIDLSNLWRIDDKEYLTNSQSYYGRSDAIFRVSCYKTTGPNKEKVGEIWKRQQFIPMFYKLEELYDNTIEQNEVICFSPDLKKIRGRATELGWKIINVATGDAIEPQSLEIDSYGNITTQNPVIPLEPFFGCYDYKTLPQKGYYDVELRYELVDDTNHGHIYQSKSQFIIE